MKNTTYEVKKSEALLKKAKEVINGIERDGSDKTSERTLGNEVAKRNVVLLRFLCFFLRGNGVRSIW